MSEGVISVSPAIRKIDSWKERTRSYSDQMRFYRRRSFFRKEPKEVKAHLRYRFAERNRGRWPIKAICKALGVSESSYYCCWKNAGEPDRDEVLSVAMQQILGEHPYSDNYRAPR